MRQGLDSLALVAGTMATVGMILCGCARSRAGGDGDAAGIAPGGGAMFEGTIQMSIPGMLARATFEMKGEKVRWNLLPTDPGAGYRIFDGSARRLFTVDPNVPSVVASEVENPMDAPSVTASGTSGASGARGANGLAWTLSPGGAGPSTVAGHACDRFIATNGSLTFEVCAARDMARIPLEHAFPNVGSAIPFLGAIATQPGLPLAVARTDGNKGRRAEPILLTMQLRPTPIDDAQFVVPDFPVTNVKHLAAPRAAPR